MNIQKEWMKLVNRGLSQVTDNDYPFFRALELTFFLNILKNPSQPDHSELKLCVIFVDDIPVTVMVTIGVYIYIYITLTWMDKKEETLHKDILPK